MVLKSVYSILILMLFTYSSSCRIEITDNKLLEIAYQLVGIILLGLALITIYTYIVSDQQKRITLRAQAINYLFSIFILIALPSFSAFLCTIQTAMFGEVAGNGDYITSSINYLNQQTNGILDSIFDMYSLINTREGKANTPYSFTIVSVGISGYAILLAIMSIDQPNLFITAVQKSLIFPIITYFPYKQNMIYNSMSNRIVRDLEMIYLGLQVHVFILRLIQNGLFAGMVIGGVVIRLIPGLRKAGDMLIAFGLGMHVLYPFIYSVYLQAFSSIFEKDNGLYNPHYVKEIFLNTKYSYYTISTYQLMIITLPNLSIAIVAAFAMNAYKTFDFIESM